MAAVCLLEATLLTLPFSPRERVRCLHVMCITVSQFHGQSYAFMSVKLDSAKSRRWMRLSSIPHTSQLRSIPSSQAPKLQCSVSCLNCNEYWYFLFSTADTAVESELLHYDRQLGVVVAFHEFHQPFECLLNGFTGAMRFLIKQYVDTPHTLRMAQCFSSPSTSLRREILPEMLRVGHLVLLSAVKFADANVKHGHCRIFVANVCTHSKVDH